MSVSRKSRRALVALSSVLLTAPLLTIPAGASSAAPVREVVAAASRTAAPTCIAVKISRTKWGSPKATVKNNCSSTRRVKVVWQFAADSSCLIISKGKSKSDTTGLAGSFDGVYNC